jgi:tetratricopeptide (TPR) repeat protein
MAKTDELLAQAKLLLEDERYNEVAGLLTDKELDGLGNAQLYFYRAWAHHQLGENGLSKEYSEKAKAIGPDLKGTFVTEGNNLYGNSKYGDAITAYDKAIFLDPNYSIAYFNKGLALYILGDYEKAVANLDTAILFQADYINAFFYRGLCLYYIHDYNSAILDFDKVVALKPDFIEAHYNKGLAWFELKEYDKAIADFSGTMGLDENYYLAYNNRGRAYYAKNDFENAASDFTKAISLKPDYKDAYLNRGLVWYYSNDFKKAIEDFDSAIQIDPDYTLAYGNRGLAYYNLNDFDKAMADYDKTILLQPDYIDSFLNRGLIWYYKGEYEKAIRDYTKAIEIDPDYLIAYNNRGLALYYSGEYNAAISDYNKAISLKPGYIDAFINRGIAYFYKGQYNKAIVDYNKALELNNNLEYVYFNIGLAQFNKGFYHEAIENFNKAIDLKPDYPEALNNRGMSWNEVGNYAEAIKDCSEAIKIYPNYPDAYNTRGISYLFMNDFLRAEQEFKTVAASSGYEALGNVNLGILYCTNGELKKAGVFFEEALAFDKSEKRYTVEIEIRKEKHDRKMELAKAKVPIETLAKIAMIEEKIYRARTNIRKYSKSDAQYVVHYTKLFVADIYVKSLGAKMHYSNAIYMNDPNEGKSLFKYFNDDKITQAFINGEKRNESSVYLGSFLPTEKTGQGPSSEDELVMWRTYGKDVNGKEAAGCNLVLSSEFFKTMKKPVADGSTKPETGQNTSKQAMIGEEDFKNKLNDEELLNVIYIETEGYDKYIRNDPDGKIKTVLSELKKLLHILMDMCDEQKGNTEFQKYIEYTIFNDLSKINFLFKSAHYSAENEVRVIRYERRESELIKYMDIKEPNLPPKRFYIESRNDILPFIRKIYLGPKVENHQHWALYFDFEIRQRAKELENLPGAGYELTPSDIQISKSVIDFQ